VVLILGATIGMEVASTVYNMTNDFQAVFAGNTAIALIALVNLTLVVWAIRSLFRGIRTAKNGIRSDARTSDR